MQNTALIPQNNPAGQLLARLADKYGVDRRKVGEIIKATCIKPPSKWDKETRDWQVQKVSDEQLAAFLIVADQYDLNPFLKEIYAFPDKTGGITPMVPIDGFIKIANRQKNFNGLEFNYSEKMVTLEYARPCFEWIEAVVHIAGREFPVKIREYLDECYRGPTVKEDFKTKEEKIIDGPWQTYTKRMLRHKAVKEAVRVAFGFAVPDEEEAEDIVNRIEAVDVDFKRLSAPESEQPENLFQDLMDKLIQFGQPVDHAALERFCKQSALQNEISVVDLYRAAMESLDNLNDFHEAFQTWSAPKPTPKPRPPKPKPATVEPTPTPNTTEKPPAPEPDDDGPGETDTPAKNMLPDIWKPSVEMRRQIRRCGLDPEVVIAAYVAEMGRRGIDQADEMRAKEMEIRSWPDSRAKLYYESLPAERRMSQGAGNE